MGSAILNVNTHNSPTLKTIIQDCLQIADSEFAIVINYRITNYKVWLLQKTWNLTLDPEEEIRNC